MKNIILLSILIMYGCFAKGQNQCIIKYETKSYQQFPDNECFLISNVVDSTINDTSFITEIFPIYKINRKSVKIKAGERRKLIDKYLIYDTIINELNEYNYKNKKVSTEILLILNDSCKVCTQLSVRMYYPKNTVLYEGMTMYEYDYQIVELYFKREYVSNFNKLLKDINGIQKKMVKHKIIFYPYYFFPVYYVEDVELRGLCTTKVYNIEIQTKTATRRK